MNSMADRPIATAILERCNGNVSRDTGGNLVFGVTADDADSALRYGTGRLAAAFMAGDMDAARDEAQRIAIARDSLPTTAERNAIPYIERLARVTFCRHEITATLMFGETECLVCGHVD